MNNLVSTIGSINLESKRQAKIQSFFKTGLKSIFGIGLLTGVLMSGIGSAHAMDGMIVLPSPHDVATTMDKLEAVVTSKGMTVMARVDHAANAKKNDLELRPTQLLLFGNPKVGTPLMLCSQSIAIDLPQKMLVWQDEDGKVFLAYNDPAYLKARHATEGCDAVFEKVAGALGNFAKAATAP